MRPSRWPEADRRKGIIRPAPGWLAILLAAVAASMIGASDSGAGSSAPAAAASAEPVSAATSVVASVAAPEPAGAVVAAADSTSDGARALRRIADRFLALDTFSAEFEQFQYWIGADTTSPSFGTLYLKRPDLFRIEYRQPKGHLQVSDGKTVWTYVPENREVLTTRLKGEAGKGGGDLLRWVLENSRAEAAVQKDVVEGRPAVAVTLNPDPGLGLSRVRLWTRPGSPDLIQYEITDSSGNRSVYLLSKARYHPSLSASLFRFTPPPGVPVVELGQP